MIEDEVNVRLEINNGPLGWRSIVSRVAPERIEIVRDAARVMTLALGPEYACRLVSDSGMQLRCDASLATWEPLP